MSITKQRQKYTARVVKFTGQVLFTMWQHAELREVYKKHGWKEADFVSKTGKFLTDQLGIAYCTELVVVGLCDVK